MKARSIRRSGWAWVAVVIVLTGVAGAADWPQFRGPNQDGISEETGLLRSWPEDGPKRLWSTPLGDGYSAISAVGDRLYTMYADGDDEVLVSLAAATGEEKWRYRMGDKWKDMMGSGPRSTPTVRDGVVYALGAHGTLAALDAASGAERWRQDLKETLGAKPPTWGIATSPVVEGEMLILDAGGTRGRSVVALKRADGSLIWHAESDKAGYAMPLPVTVGGRRLVVFFTGTRVVGVDPADGSVLWKRPWRTAYDVNAATPIFIPPDKVFVASGYATGGGLFQIAVTDGGASLQEVWFNEKMRNQFSSSVYVDGHIYGFDNSTLKCLDAQTGEERWAVREGFGHGSLTYADGHLYVLGDRGKLALVEATPAEYRPQGEAQVLKGKCWTVPTLSDGRLYVRNEKELVALDIRGPGS